ncbi:hypothetical protein [Cucumibacter marinus]|uniref:hypothetical protein n=1 Tax=Cucumibacter marinus TaxID=1121252 RepID=UPI00048E506E|nr:hypothetical protein [Cucumibacter marinus]
MSYFQLRELESVVDDEILLAYAETLAFATGEFRIDEIPLDESELILNYTASSAAELRDDLAEEPQFALQAALEDIEGRIWTLAKHNQSLLSDHYPFDIAPRPGIVLARKPSLRENLEGIFYLCMQLHTLYDFKCIEFEVSAHGRSEKPHLDFTQPFQRLFEVISGITVANEMNGIPILLSDCRSSADLLKRLEEVCRLSGLGKTKAHEQLNLSQEHSNDGGIDAVVLKMDGEELRETTLVGATTQKTSLRHKMVTSTSIGRFKNFLEDGSALGPFRGCFVYPTKYQESHRYQCTESECVYFHKETILKNLRPVGAASWAARRCKAVARRTALNQIRKIEGLIFKLEFTDYLLGDICKGTALT